jgi:copper chaperone CopZ
MHDKCHVIPFSKEVVLEPNEKTQAITLEVIGMGCINCANRVHNGLVDHPGVVKAEVSHITGTAEVTYVPAKVSVPQLIVMVARAGDYRHTYRAIPWEAGGG